MDKKQPYRKEWETDDQYACHETLAEIVGGFHHIQHKVKPYGDGIETSILGSWATFDFNELTRTVVLAHDNMVRISVTSSGRGMFRLILHKRQARTGRMQERHPTIEDAIKTIRGE